MQMYLRSQQGRLSRTVHYLEVYNAQEQPNLKLPHKEQNMTLQEIKGGSSS